MKMNGINASARLLCGAATFLALAVTGAPVMAQEQAGEQPAAVEGEEEGEAIVVTGIRGSIQSSLDAKREATSIVEVISSEDLGLLPDLSIADSLARLPGVTAQRVRGRSQSVSIRGLGPDFSLALLNGREVVSAGNNRGIEFDQFPSELVAQGIVYKTGDAQLAAIGIAGAVDLRTVKPLDAKKRQVTLSGTYTYNDNGSLNPDFSASGYRFFGSYIDQNEAGTLGWSIGATTQSIPTQIIQRELKTANGQVDRVTTPGGTVFPRDNPRQGAQSREFKRTSVAGSLQFEPTDRFSLTIDGFYTNTEDAGIFRGTETPIASWSFNGGAQVEEVTGSGPFATSATYSNVFPILRTDTEGNESDIFAFGGNAEWKATDNLGFVLDYGYSTLSRNDIDYESYAGTGPNGTGAADTLTFTFPEDGQYTIDTQLDYTDASDLLLIDPGGWGQVGFLRVPETNDELHQLRAEAYWEFDGGLIDRITAGWLYTDRAKDFDNNGIFLRAGTGFTNGPGGNSAPIPSDLVIGTADTGGIGLDIVAYDPSTLLTNGTYRQEAATDDTEWLVEEQIHNFYIQADIDGDLGSVPVRGNIGLRYVDTSQGSTGTISGGFVNEVSTSYDNWLPSANLSFELAEDTFIRVAFAQTITRARLDQLAANQNLTPNNQVCTDSDGDQIVDTVLPGQFDPPSNVCFTLGGGNPFLQPYRSTSYDISFEKYFSPGTAIIVAAFYKDLSDWVVNLNESFDLSQQINNAGFGGILQTNPEVALGNFTGPVNFSDGRIAGIEGTVRVNFGDLTDTLDGFGGFYSITYSDAEITPPGTQAIPIPGYSDLTWSGDIFFEKYGFRAKLAARYRGGFLSEVPNFAGGLEGAEARSETILDAQLGYTFEKEGSFLNGVQILAEVFNLTDQPFVTQNELFDRAPGSTPPPQSLGTSFASRHELYGRTFQFTLRKSF